MNELECTIDGIVVWSISCTGVDLRSEWTLVGYALEWTVDGKLALSGVWTGWAVN